MCCDATRLSLVKFIVILGKAAETGVFVVSKGPITTSKGKCYATYYRKAYHLPVWIYCSASQ